MLLGAGAELWNLTSPGQVGTQPPGYGDLSLVTGRVQYRIDQTPERAP